MLLPIGRKKFASKWMLDTISIEYYLKPENVNGQFGADQLASFLRDQIVFQQNNVSGKLIVSVTIHRNDFRTI
jgi:hypothetical protein